MTNKAVCLISGGLDSCVTAFLAKKEGYDELHAISFDYGQLHKQELSCAKKIARAVGATNHILFFVDLKRFGGSSLLDKTFVFPQDRKISEIGKGKIPSTYVPARNTVFLSLALGYAEVLDADAIFLGTHAMDYSGYPDCRPEYLQAFQAMANLATRRGVEGRPILIKAPILHLTKAEIIKKGIELGVPFEYTWSCYQGKRKACGRCDSCLLRLKGFQEAGLDDPISYEQYPNWYKKP